MECRLTIRGAGGRSGGQHPLQVVLHAANPLTYWSAFEIWSFPFPLHAVSPGIKIKFGIALCLMSAWAVILGWTAFIEGKEAVLKSVGGIGVSGFWSHLHYC